jgi:hypothetical protein
MATNADKALFKAKNKKVKDKLKDYAPDGGAFAVQLRRGGQVQIQSLDTKLDAEGCEVLEVYIGPGSERGDPHFIITNPPTYVKERDGSLTEDPIAAVAEVIARFGGRQKGRKLA